VWAQFQHCAIHPTQGDIYWTIALVICCVFWVVCIFWFMTLTDLTLLAWALYGGEFIILCGIMAAISWRIWDIVTHMKKNGQQEQNG
jgi:hypothetical protein